MAQERRDPASLPVFNKIPRSKLAIPGLALKFLGKTSVFVHTEGLGRRPYHGRVAILVNRHTTGAAEMVAQFAQENRLAVIVGRKDAGPSGLPKRFQTRLRLSPGDSGRCLRQRQREPD